MQKYKIICKACNKIFGTTENPLMDGIPAKCSICGMERVAIEPIIEEVVVGMDFDLFINNRKEGTSIHNGFQLSVDMIKNKTDEQIKVIFIEESAKALGNLLTSIDLKGIFNRNGGN